MERDEMVKTIADHYGYEHQLNKLVEEIGELLVEISKLRAAKDIADAYAAIVRLEKELADVEILIMQLKMLGDAEHVEDTIDYKIQRQIKRIEKEKGTC